MIRHRLWVVVGWVVMVVLAGLLAKNITHNLTSTGFDNPKSTAIWADNQLGHLQSRPAVEPLLIQGVAYPKVASWAEANHIPHAWLYRADALATTIVPSPTTSPTRLLTLFNTARRHGATATWVDPASVGLKVIHDTRTTLASSLPVALPFLVVLLLLVFGSLTAAVLPLVVAGIGAIFALGALDLIENVVTLSAYLTDIVSFLALGVGVDYALFISARFRQALAEGKDADAAAVEAMQRAGRSVLFSGVAVALAILTLFIGGNPYWRGIAIGGSVAVLSVLVVTHTLLPALLRFLGHRINWGRIPWLDAFHRFWPTVAGWIRRHPGWALLAAVIALGMPAWFGTQLNMQTPANVAVMLPRRDPLRKSVGFQQKVWGPGVIAPIVVVMQLKTPITQTSSWQKVAEVARRLARDPNVEAVSSPADYGLAPAMLAQAANGRIPSPEVKSLLSAYTNVGYNPHLVAMFVTARQGPNQPATVDLVGRIQRQLHQWLPGQRTGVGGVTALLNGFNQLTRARLPWILAAVATVALVILYLATGSLWQALLGVVFDGLVALATAGILVLTVQHGAIGLEAEPLDSSITPLIFVLLFGLSMDYEVILLHRIQELWHRGGSVAEAAMSGLSGTGSMITGAGMIMVIVFIALLLSALEVMKTLGIGLTAAILLDTWLVRSLLVPGSITVLGRFAFWPNRQPSETAEM
jgi:RND superfamily putative drug exporter